MEKPNIELAVLPSPKLAKAELPRKVTLPTLDKISLNGYDLEIDYYLKTEYTDVYSASAELPTVIEWVNSNMQDYTEAKMTAKRELREAEALAYFDLKAGTFAAKYTGKMTEDAIAHAVTLNQDVKVAAAKFASYSAWVGRLQNLIFSLQSKLDMVRSSESTRRALAAGEQSRVSEE